MRYSKPILVAFFVGCVAVCAQDVLSEADQLTDRGDFKGAALLLDNALHAPGLSPARSRQLAFDRDVL
ncbi:MAG TPA: hypothetical protein VH619_15440, partial [Verrucomicrobiae bacterium]|nr:hypothetical protein [Verrucomicrobiae bacterium]